jgi:hypothetical protein
MCFEKSQDQDVTYGSVKKRFVRERIVYIEAEEDLGPLAKEAEAQLLAQCAPERIEAMELFARSDKGKEFHAQMGSQLITLYLEQIERLETVEADAELDKFQS